MNSRWFIPILALALLLLSLTDARACEMCKDAIATNAGSGGIDGTGGSAGLNFNASIFYMLGGVFAVMSWIGWVMYKSVHTSRPRVGFPVKTDRVVP
jgi:hypothetical protein